MTFLKCRYLKTYADQNWLPKFEKETSKFTVFHAHIYAPQMAKKLL